MTKQQILEQIKVYDEMLKGLGSEQKEQFKAIQEARLQWEIKLYEEYNGY